MRSPFFRPRLRPQATKSPLFTIAPWCAEYGDPRKPRELAGSVVKELVLVRADEPGALVALSDGRHAITGRLLVVGNVRHLKRYVRYRSRRSDSEGERRWLQAVKDELRQRMTGPSRTLAHSRKLSAISGPRSRRVDKARTLPLRSPENGTIPRPTKVSTTPQPRLAPGPDEPA